MRITLLIIIMMAFAYADNLNIGRWQNGGGGRMSIGRFQPMYDEAAPDSFTLDTNAVNGSITLSSPGNNLKYEDGDTVRFTAVPALYYIFKQWSDSLTGTDNPDSLVMGTNKIVTAEFERDSIFIYNVVQDSGVIGSSITIICKGMGSTQGATELSIGGVTFTVIDLWRDDTVICDIPAGLDTGWVDFFAEGHWNTDTLLNGFKIISAPPDSFTLDTNAVNGHITLAPAPSGTGKYVDGTVVTVTAVADQYYIFSEWSDSLTGSTTPTTITMDTNKTVTATFVQDSVEITDVSPDSGVVGTVITVTGRGYQPTQGSSTLAMDGVSMGAAYSWSRTNIVDTVPSIDTGWIDIIVHGYWNSDTLLNAFKVIAGTPPPDSFDITIQTTGSGSGTYSLTPNLTRVETGTEVTVRAFPAAGSYWLADDTIADTPYVMMVVRDTTLVLRYELIATLDSVRAKTRRGTLLSDCRVLDTVYFYFENQADSGEFSAVRLNTTGTIMVTVIDWGYPIAGVIPNGTPRGYYRPRCINATGVISDALLSNAMYVKIPSAGSY
jgi:Divergent InlB B-repeat domain/IPT/TIG domain